MARRNVVHGYGTPVVTTTRPLLGGRYGLHWLHARPGGGPCLRDQTSWRTISGIIVNTAWGSAFLHFRRWRTFTDIK